MNQASQLEDNKCYNGYSINSIRVGSSCARYAHSSPAIPAPRDYSGFNPSFRHTLPMEEGYKGQPSHKERGLT